MTDERPKPNTEDTPPAAREGDIRLREAASDLVDALCLPGHPIEEAWGAVCLFTGRYCEPFLSRFADTDQTPEEDLDPYGYVVLDDEQGRTFWTRRDAAKAEAGRWQNPRIVTVYTRPTTAPQEPVPVEMLGEIAKGILGDHANVETTDLGPLPAWEDPDGHTHPPTPVLRVDVLIDDKSFGMEGPATSAPGMVAHIATQLKGSELASPIIAPPAGFKA